MTITAALEGMLKQSQRRAVKRGTRWLGKSTDITLELPARRQLRINCFHSLHCKDDTDQECWDKGDRDKNQHRSALLNKSLFTAYTMKKGFTYTQGISTYLWKTELKGKFVLVLKNKLNPGI